MENLELPPRIITFLIGNPYKPSFVTVTGWGVVRKNIILPFISLPIPACCFLLGEVVCRFAFFLPPQEVAYQKASEGFEVAKVAGAMAAEARIVAGGTLWL